MSKGFLNRFSNVLAWAGFIIFAWGIFYALYMKDSGEGLMVIIVCFISQFLIGVINYLISGKLRLIPW